MSTSETERRVKNLFSQIDIQTERFASESNLKCPPQCGWCCTNPETETTIADMLPIAFALKATQKLGEAAAKAEFSLQSHCIFFEKTENYEKGRCTIYPFRPSICRLFGFAAVNDKHGKPKLAFCKIHKITSLEAVEKAKDQVESGYINAPLFSECASQLSEIDPTLASKYYQINKALLLAIEKVALLPS